jgi:L-iditol 2-dehydrogenase
MKQAWLASPGRIELREVDVPKPYRGEILIRIRAALTCGTDLKAFLRGHKLIPMPGPFGHEFSGVVAQAGRDVRKFKKGDPVMSVHTAPCNSCAYCKKGLHNLCENIMDTKVLGAFGEYLLLPEHIARQNAFRKPENLGFDEACFLEPLSCVVHGMSGLPFGKDDKALVMGAGPIGLLHLLLLKSRGVETAVCALEPARLALAKKLGAADVFKPDKLNNALKKFAPGFDCVFECTGRKEVWEESVNYLRRGGTAVLFGGLPKGTVVSFPAEKIHYDQMTLKGSFHYRPKDVKEAFRLLSKGVINVKPLISGSYKLKDIEKPFERLSKGDGVKFVIRT